MLQKKQPKPFQPELNTERWEAKDGEPLLEIRDLNIIYKTDARTVRAVNKLNLKLGAGESLGFVGETGAGKTTTALGILRLVPDPPGIIESGQILFEGRDLLGLEKDEMRHIRGSRISMIFQDPMTSLNPSMTVGAQIEEVLGLHEKLSGVDLCERARHMLEVVGIRPERFNDYPHQFSGGMKQRVCIAMALACNPQMIIADEPTTALDVTIQAQVLELMNKLKDEFNTSMLLITHDLGVVAEICDRVAIMYAGSVVEDGDTDEIYDHPMHPYTRGLFASIPSLDEDVESLHVIPGAPPDPADLPSGCCFHPRCPYATERCRKEIPEMRAISGVDHQLACHYVNEKGEFSGKEAKADA